MPPAWSDRLWDLLLSPALWLSVILAVGYSILFSLWRGSGWRRLLRDLLVGCVGFCLGQLAGYLLGVALLRVGEVHVLWGTLGAALALLIGNRHRGV